MLISGFSREADGLAQGPAFPCGDRDRKPHGAVWGLDPPHSSRSPRPWPRPCAGPHGHLNLRPSRNPGSPLVCHTLPVYHGVQAPCQELDRDGAHMAPTQECWRSLLDPTCLSSFRVHPASWLSPQCPLPYGPHVLSQPYPFLSRTRTLSLPALGQAEPSARNALSICANSTTFQARCKKHIPRKPSEQP